MAYAYQNIVIGKTLTFDDEAFIVTPERGSIITADGVHTISIGAGKPGQVLTSDIEQDVVGNPSGLIWKEVDIDNVDLSGLAGKGLTLDGQTLSVATQYPLSIDEQGLLVDSSDVAGVPLISVGVVGKPAVYGPLDLASVDVVVSGVLPTSNGGTGTTGFKPDRFVIADADGNLTSSPFDPSGSDFVDASGTFGASAEADQAIYKVEAVPSTVTMIEAWFISYSAADNKTATFTARVAVTASQLGDVSISEPDIVFSPADSTQKVNIALQNNVILFFVGGDAASWKLRYHETLTMDLGLLDGPIVVDPIDPTPVVEAPVVAAPAEEAAPVVAEEAAPAVAEEAPVVAEEAAPVVAEEAAPVAPQA